MKKRLIALFCIVLAAFSLTACSRRSQRAVENMFDDASTIIEDLGDQLSDMFSR